MFRFTIRELLILTVTAGLAVGWWIDRSSLANRISEIEAKFGAMRGQGYKLLWIPKNSAPDSIPVAAPEEKRTYIEVPTTTDPVTGIVRPNLAR
jgi:hypothetical protein